MAATKTASVFLSLFLIVGCSDPIELKKHDIEWVYSNEASGIDLAEPLLSWRIGKYIESGEEELEVELFFTHMEAESRHISLSNNGVITDNASKSKISHTKSKILIGELYKLGLFRATTDTLFFKEFLYNEEKLNTDLPTPSSSVKFITYIAESPHSVIYVANLFDKADLERPFNDYKNLRDAVLLMINTADAASDKD